MPTEFQYWLKNSIAGIILLGAIGSLLAVLVARLLLSVKDKVLPAPYMAHKEKRRKQAYFLGFAHAMIEADPTGRRLFTFLAYRLSRLLGALTLFLFSAVLASNVLVFQAEIVLTVGLFLSVVAAFLTLYWAHHEFEYIHRTYLWLWKKSLGNAEKGYQTHVSKSPPSKMDGGEHITPPSGG